MSNLKNSKAINSPQGSRTRGQKTLNSKTQSNQHNKEIEILDIDKDKLSKIKTAKKQKKGSKVGNIVATGQESGKAEQANQGKGDEKQKLL